MKGNAKCKKSRFQPPFGDLEVTQRVHLWLDGKRVVDRLLISANWIFLSSSHGYGTIKRNMSKSAFSEELGHFERKFLVDGDVARNPSMDH